jgi:phosphatidate cytidylyltransferase
MVTVFSAIVAALAAYEYVQIASAGGSPIPLWWMAASVALFFLVVNFQPQDTIAAVSLATLVLFTWSAFTTPLHRVLGETAAGLFALLYICYPLTLLPQLLVKWDGPALLLFLFICVWSGDIAALYIGKRYGRRKLARRLSPNKTWEGAIASVVASALFGMALVGVGEYLSRHGSNFTRLHTSEPWWQSLALAIILNIAAQLGDLLESALKRGVNMKDSGTLLPGHGGILDRIDALLLAAPVLWFVLALKDYYSMSIF